MTGAAWPGAGAPEAPYGRLTPSNQDAGSGLSPRSSGTLVAGRGNGVSGRGCVRGVPVAGVRRTVSLHSSPAIVRDGASASSVISTDGRSDGASVVGCDGASSSTASATVPPPPSSPEA